MRQDRLLFEGLAGTAKTGTGDADDPIELALARIRQLAAHEVGHTLGLGHNFAASTYGGRASVMDYPAPLIGLRGDGELDFSRAYGAGAGAWDEHAIRYAYSEFPPGAAEALELERNREMLASATEPVFDALGAAATAAQQVVQALLEPERLGRLIDFHRRDPSLPGPREVLEAMLERAFALPEEGESPRHAEIRHVVRRVIADRWLGLAGDPATTPAIRAHLELALRQARKRLPVELDLAQASAHDLALAGDLDRFFTRSEAAAPEVHAPAPLPPGSPIGGRSPALAACGFGG